MFWAKKITEKGHSFKDFAGTCDVEVLHYFNLELELEDTESAIKSKLKKWLSELRGFKFVTTLVLVFRKIESKDKTKNDNFYLISKAEIKWHWWCVRITLFYNYMEIQKSLGKRSGCIIDLVIDHIISISKHNPLAGSSYIKISKELEDPRKRLINIQNIDNIECFKRNKDRYLNPANHHPARITKADKDFVKKIYF